MRKQHYIYLSHQERVPVSEDVYHFHSRWIAKERYYARRDHRCGNRNYWNCNGDCGKCVYQLPGDIVCLDAQMNDDSDIQIPDHSFDLDANTANQMMLNALHSKLDELVPHGGEIFKMLAHGYNERQIAEQLGIRQSTLNYQKNKLFRYIREHREEWTD